MTRLITHYIFAQITWDKRVCHMFTLITLPQGCRDKCSQITQFFLKTQE